MARWESERSLHEALRRKKKKGAGKRAPREQNQHLPEALRKQRRMRAKERREGRKRDRVTRCSEEKSEAREER